ncbi:hypothetical protein BN8_00978 [Fibrisoma limi BUZ 3]|uniref:Uncharacterized protein n=1 Tax=Fibrisoma limi BUZ 3 TaxID=1185876 RepID=I2GDN7_9BACT|nr:hypothetical protein [Fibrisoma limi]CCH52011.1 hypothetical protein BN8_00978 [Fibrisoma limi BUZ 3]
MTITFEAVHLPFKVGDTIYVNEKHDQRSDNKAEEAYPYFEAEIERIFFDGRLEEMSVVTEPVETFEMKVSTAVYVVKPTGKYSQLMRLPVRINIPIKEPKLFATEHDLKEYLQDRDKIEKDIMPNVSKSD